MKQIIIFTIVVIFAFSGCKKECTCSTTSQTDPLKNGLIAYYPFNGNTNDESGNNNNGTANGGMLTTDKFGNINKAYYFDGSHYIKVSNSISLSSVANSFSISAWISNQQPATYIVCKSSLNGTTMQFRLYADNGMIHFANYNKAIDFNNAIASINIWKHLVVTSDGSTAKYYLNGSLVNTLQLNNDNSVNNNASDMYIGADTHGAVEYYSGKLDEIRIYNRVLSENEIQQLFND
jgi:hypothetical protein